jgi:benzoyl-CoA reductase/2-hydroxyglutaryl-CoA dehydratase subunit BcrC/BadD/HgdB
VLTRVNVDGPGKISAIVRACRLISRMNQVNPHTPKSDQLYYKMLGNYYTRVMNARKEGNFVAAHTVFFPSEILYAMNIVPMHTEMTTWLIALFLGEQADLLAAGAQLGLAPEICSPHRGLAGAFSIGALPKPDVMLWSNLICDNTAKSGELVMELNQIPGYFLDHPFQDSEIEKKYLVGELKGMIEFLEKQSGHKMDYDRLSEIIAMMNKQLELVREIGRLRKTVPSPFPIQGFLKLLSVDYMFPGQPETIEYLETLLGEMKELIKQGKGVVENERFRLMTLFLSPMFLTSFLEKVYTAHGAVSVVEPLFTKWREGELDPNRPLESVVTKSFMIPESNTMYGPLTERTLTDVIDDAREYRVDGVVYWAFIGCRHTCATIKLFKDRLNEVGIPVLTLDCDLVDPTINPKEDTEEKLERFFELLEDR